MTPIKMIAIEVPVIDIDIICGILNTLVGDDVDGTVFGAVGPGPVPTVPARNDSETPEMITPEESSSST